MAAGRPGCQRKASADLEGAERAGKAPCSETARDRNIQEGTTAQEERHGRGDSVSHGSKKDSGLPEERMGSIDVPRGSQEGLANRACISRSRFQIGSEITTDLVTPACLLEQTSQWTKQALILHVGNQNAMHAATLSSMEELGVFRFFHRSRVSIVNRNSELLFRTAKAKA